MARQSPAEGATMPAAAAAVLSARPRVVEALPTCNAAQIPRMTYPEPPHDGVDRVIFVDDGSTDGTVALARERNRTLFLRDRTYGYGAH